MTIWKTKATKKWAMKTEKRRGDFKTVKTMTQIKLKSQRRKPIKCYVANGNGEEDLPMFGTTRAINKYNVVGNLYFCGILAAVGVKIMGESRLFLFSSLSSLLLLLSLSSRRLFEV